MYVLYKDLVEGSEPCTGYECKDCPFYRQNADKYDCRWMEYIDSLTKYYPKMVEVKNEL